MYQLPHVQRRMFALFEYTHLLRGLSCVEHMGKTCMYGYSYNQEDCSYLAGCSKGSTRGPENHVDWSIPTDTISLFR